MTFFLMIVLVAASSDVELLPKLIKQVKPSVVALITYDTSGLRSQQGSGFLVAPGRIATNCHVIDGASRIEARTSSGKSFWVNSVLAADYYHDLAILGLDSTNPLGNSPLSITRILPEEGEQVFVIGSPLGLEATVTNGLVSAVRDMPRFGKLIQITAPVSPGSSGSPVINSQGKVVGIATSQFPVGQNLNFAVPSERILKLSLDSPKTLAEFSRDASAEKRSAGFRLLEEGKSLFRSGYSSFDELKDELEKGIPNVEKQRSNEKAISLFVEATRLVPQMAEGWRILCNACDANRNYAQAIDACKQAFRLNPEDVDSQVAMANSYRGLRQYQQAIDVYNEILKVSPFFLYARDKAHCYEELGLYEKAIETHLQATKLEPRENAWLSYEAITKIYLYKVNDPRAAIETSKELLRLAPEDTEAHYFLGVAYHLDGNRNAALAEYELLKLIDGNLASKLLSVIRPRN